MADNVAVTPGTGATIHADEYTHASLGSGKTQLVKLVDGTLDSGTAIAAGGGVEAGALRVTIASDSTGVVSVDDNGGSLTVDGAVTVTNSTAANFKAELGASTAAIGKLAANGNIDIGAVEVAPNANVVYGTSGAITGTTSTQVIASQGASTKIYVTSLLVTNSHATVGTLVTIQDDAASPVVLFAGYAASAGGGFSITFPTPIPTTANQKLMAVCGTTGTNVYVSAAGFKGA